MSEGKPLDEPTTSAEEPPAAQPATEAPGPPPPKGFSADARLLAIATPLGERAVDVHSMQGEEGLSRLFRFDLELAFTDTAADPRALLGKGVTLRLRLGQDARYLNGLICRIAQAPTTKQANLHRATMVPWLWLLTRSADCRIFQNLSVPAIVERVFEERGFKDYQLRLQRTYPLREYLRPVPRDGLQLRLQAAGARRYLVRVRARERPARAGAGRRSCRAQALPGAASGALQPVEERQRRRRDFGLGGGS